jgi:hypothetical protein
MTAAFLEPRFNAMEKGVMNGASVIAERKLGVKSRVGACRSSFAYSRTEILTNTLELCSAFYSPSLNHR